MVTSPDSKKVHRVFLVGQKQLPEILEGESSSEERNWALNVLTTSDVEDIRKEFLPAEYQTETRGTRRMSGAVPAGEGKYSIVEHEGHSELAIYVGASCNTWTNTKRISDKKRSKLHNICQES